MTADDRTTAGLRLLIVEDDALIAALIEDMLIELGCRVVGSANSVTTALELLDTLGSALDGAMLDANLGGEPVYPVAARLAGMGVPFAFVSGYGREGIDEAFAGRPVVDKPFDIEDLQRVLQTTFA